VAERGRGAFLEDRRLTVSATASLGASLLATGFPYDVRDTADNNLDEYAAFTRRNRSVRELGSAAITLAAVAAGRLDGYWELVLGPWDAAAGALLVEEAGGRVTALDGGPLDRAAPALVASNGHIHSEMIAILKEVRAR
jgi:myo-inositol-1(or 4)-monophosphatase